MRALIPAVLLLPALLIAAAGGQPLVEAPAADPADDPALPLDALMRSAGWIPRPDGAAPPQIGALLDAADKPLPGLEAACALPSTLAPADGGPLAAALRAGAQAGPPGGPAELLRFGPPLFEAIAAPRPRLSPGCAAALAELPADRRSGLQVVTSVLRAAVVERRCAPGAPCAAPDPEPVVLGWRAAPLGAIVELPPTGPAATDTDPPDPEAPAPGDGAPPGRHASAGPHLGAFVGTQSGLRYHHVQADGRRAIGVRLDAGITLFYLTTLYPNARVALEFEHRRRPDGLTSRVVHLGAGFPGLEVGTTRVIGAATGGRMELGIAVGLPFALTPRLSAGWVW
jgi:hypothetical protein